MIVKSRKIPDQALLKSQFAQRQREMASSQDDNKSDSLLTHNDFRQKLCLDVRCSGISQIIM